MLTRQDLHRLMGTEPAAGHDEPLIVESERHHAGFREQSVRVPVNGGRCSGTLLLPDDVGQPVPGVLYCHAHGDRYDIGAAELMDGRPALQTPAYGQVLARSGYAVLCVDMPGFGARQPEGSENHLAKAAFWRGGTLFGRMLGDLARALGALARIETVDAARIATLGISMGATHAYWLAALDARVMACAHMCAFANMGPLINAGAHDRHGIYMTVPGLIAIGDMGDVAAMVAPRPQWIGAGLSDPLTPRAALDPALETVRSAYAAAGAMDRLTTHVDPASGHEETPAMRREVLSFLADTLGR